MRRLSMLCLLAAATMPAMAQPYGESITVARILVDVRVTDAGGNPIRDLKPDDFRVTVGGSPARIESAEWIDDAGYALPGENATLDDLAPLQRRGRLIVVFIQTDLARNDARTSGQMHFRTYADRLVESFAAEDRIAVFSFDSHLEFRLDFSNDASQIQAAMRESILINNPPPPPVVPNPALARRLDAREMRDAADSETSLIIIGNALRSIEGPKTLILMGWGLGERAGQMIVMRPKWPIVRRVLDAARVSIFALDTTMADYHDLEIPLARAAKETGGFYAKTYHFPQIAIDRLQRTLAGHYELELRAPAGLKPGTYALAVDVGRRGVTVLAPSSLRTR